MSETPKTDSIRALLDALMDEAKTRLERDGRLVVSDDCPPEKRAATQALADALNRDPKFCEDFDDALDREIARQMSELIWGKADV